MATKILLVDDEVDLVEVTGTRLKSKGFEVICAYDGPEALSKAGEHMPDVILLDLFMPVMDGYEVCKELKKDVKLKQIPIIVFSASDCAKSCVEEARKFGASDFISKPFDSDELIDMIKTYAED